MKRPKNRGMDPNLNLSEIKKFFCDISVYLKTELQSTEYQNAPKCCKGFNEAKCKELLDRCNSILAQFDAKDCEQELDTNTRTIESTECSYLDMSARNKALPSEYVDFSGPPDKEDHLPDPPLEQLKDEDDDKEIYEICNVSLQTTKALDDVDILNCPYVGLPATHLSIQKSPKYGQLLRIEKRLFFGQTKKYYCGIMQEWLLCYSDGITSIRPAFCVHLNGVEVEHYGEGKRRDLCFQITDYETSKKIIFQAATEVDTKEWIHAIEAAIRGDFDSLPVESPTKAGRNSNSRKLPTPPVDTKLCQDTFNDSIYEEPCPLYSNSYTPPSSLVIAESENLKPPDIPIKTGGKLKPGNQTKHEYDVPKPMQPIINVSPPPVEPSDTQSELILTRNKVEFQTKVKDVHNKLSNQLSSDRLKTPTKKFPNQRISCDTKKNIKGQPFKDKEKVTSTGVGGTTSITPIKNSFWNRLNKTSPQPALIKIRSVEKEKENLLSSESSTFSGPTRPSKGGKVNMIINQLEANGHLPIFTRNFERLSNAFIDSGEDCSYEPIMASGSEKS